MPIANPIATRPVIHRRNFLYAATAAVGAVGVAATAWPLIDQMNPDAQVRAVGDIIEVNLLDLLPAQQRLVRWHNVPIFVVRRTPAMLDAMWEAAFVAQLFDPDSQKRQRPAYAKNWHRLIDPAFAVLVGLCTECGCIPRYFADASVFNVAGGYVCPCCNLHYDPAGRVYAGIAACNLPVPPYEIIGQSAISIGKNPPDEFFSLDQVERI
jgi:ubiquinol-cytochrome c reductase iron-sulfur subunit